MLGQVQWSLVWPGVLLQVALLHVSGLIRRIGRCVRKVWHAHLVVVLPQLLPRALGKAPDFGRTASYKHIQQRLRSFLLFTRSSPRIGGERERKKKSEMEKEQYKKKEGSPPRFTELMLPSLPRAASSTAPAFERFPWHTWPRSHLGVEVLAAGLGFALAAQGQRLSCRETARPHELSHIMDEESGRNFNIFNHPDPRASVHARFQRKGCSSHNVPNVARGFHVETGILAQRLAHRQTSPPPPLDGLGTGHAHHVVCLMVALHEAVLGQTNPPVSPMIMPFAAAFCRFFFFEMEHDVGPFCPPPCWSRSSMGIFWTILGLPMPVFDASLSRRRTL